MIKEFIDKKSYITKNVHCIIGTPILFSEILIFTHYTVSCEHVLRWTLQVGINSEEAVLIIGP